MIDLIVCGREYEKKDLNLSVIMMEALKMKIPRVEEFFALVCPHDNHDKKWVLPCAVQF